MVYSFCRKLRLRVAQQPRRVTSCGQQTALEIMINNDIEQYFVTFIPAIGHEV